MSFCHSQQKFLALEPAHLLRPQYSLAESEVVFAVLRRLFPGA